MCVLSLLPLGGTAAGVDPGVRLGVVLGAPWLRALPAPLGVIVTSFLADNVLRPC